MRFPATPQLPQARIVVNSRCGRACFFCRPSGEGVPTRADATLTTETVVEVCTALMACGVTDFKLTGGDPALWPPLVECVERLTREVKVPRLEVVSRHPRIGELARELRRAGLEQINISIDTLDPALHRHITGVDDLPRVLDALGACISAGLRCKVNTVVMRRVNEGEIPALISFCEQKGAAQLKLLDVIRDLAKGAESFQNRLVQIGINSVQDLYSPMDRIKAHLAKRTTHTQLSFQGGLGHPMQSYMMASGLEVIVKDHRSGAWYGANCTNCAHYPCHDALMAIRLTADRRLQFCLLRDDLAVDLAGALADRNGHLAAAVRSSLKIYEEAYFREPSQESSCPVL
jgi:cyclic pyranopterin phosphate synthase